MERVDLTQLPAHVAIIMDGNGRWADRQGLGRSEGHRRGSDVVRGVVRAGRRLGLRSLTLYAFSAQNWLRPPAEVATLMALLADYLASERREILDNGIRLAAVGNTERLPRFVRERLDPLCAESASNQGMILTLALSYGGREEIVAAARALATEVSEGTLSADEIDQDAFAERLPSLLGGEVDLLIRTGGELRISNFLLWASAWAELYFTDTLWPDFEVRELYAAIRAFQQRERRFGRVPGQRNGAEYREAGSPAATGGEGNGGGRPSQPADRIGE